MTTTLLDIVKHSQGKHPQSTHAPKSGKTAPKISALTDEQMDKYYYHRSTTGKTDDILESGVIRGGLDNFGRRIYTGLWAPPLDKPTVFFGVDKSKLDEFRTTMTTSVASNLTDTKLSESGVKILMYEPSDGKYYDISPLYNKGMNERELVQAYNEWRN